MLRSPEMQRFLDGFCKDMFGCTHTSAQSANKCVVCGKPATTFRNPLSEKEYSISGMCQECQDKTFGVD